jgi:hypothetical protein
MNRSLMILLLLFGVLSIYGGVALAWNDEITHKDISEYAAEVSVLGKTSGDYLKNLGFTSGIDENLSWGNRTQLIRLWIRDGAFYEDAGNRSYNHFHNPLLQPWPTAGLSDLCLIGHCQSALLWAQSYNAGQPPVDNWSWQHTRDYYNLALTSTDPAVRRAFFAQTFRGLGQQMHLLQDMAVPYHVRNDAHPLDAIWGYSPHGYYFERWVKENKPDLAKLKTFAPNPVIPQLTFNSPSDNGVVYSTLSPITQLYDTNQYDGTNPSTGNNIGLAEYTNANYYSDDTISMPGMWTSPNHIFPHPNVSDTNLDVYIYSNAVPTTVIAEDGVPDRGFWIQKTGNEPIAHFIKPGYLTTPIYTTIGGGNVYERTFFLDDQCHHDYAQTLLPRAVGYSAGLLNYFFRGTLEISAPDQCLYGLIDGAGTQEFTKLKAKVRNTTLNETMGVGTLTAVAKYKRRTNYLQDLTNDPPTPDSIEANFSYSVSMPVDISSLSETTPQEITFNFTSSPIPAGITDLYLQIVFKGTLGNEADNAIAVGFKDLSEPTHINMFNTTDQTYIAGQLHDSSDVEKVTTTEKIAFCPSHWPVQNENEYQVRYSSIAAGEFGRIIFITDANIQIFYGVKDTQSDNPTDSELNEWYAPWGIVNQDGYTSPVYEFRGKLFHEASAYYYFSEPDENFWLVDWPLLTNDAIPATSVTW